jgi:hypothetical protein
MSNKNYYYYIEKVNSLNTLEKITHELVMFQESSFFINLYNESQETKTDNKNVDPVLRIADKFSIKKEDVPALKKAFIFFKPEIEKTIDSYIFDLKIATSFGLGIGSLIPSVITFLSKMQITISRENAILLAVGVIMGVIYTKEKDVKKIKNLLIKIKRKIKDKKLNNVIKIIKIIAEKIWIPFDKFLEFLAYTIMAIPLANFLSSFLKDLNFNPDLARQSLEGLAIAGLIQIFRQTAPKIWNKFSTTFKRRGK